jgi:hypothetical protein
LSGSSLRAPHLSSNQQVRALSGTRYTLARAMHFSVDVRHEPNAREHQIPNRSSRKKVPLLPFCKSTPRMPSRIQAISTLVDRLMRLMEGSQCIAGEESGVELALREALEKPPCAAIRKIQKQKYTSAALQFRQRKISIVVTDHGKGFDFGKMVGKGLTLDLASEIWARHPSHKRVYGRCVL